MKAYHGEAYTVVGKALVNMQFVGKAAAYPYVQVAPFALKTDYASGLFYYS